MKMTLALLIIASFGVLIMPAQAQHYYQDVNLYERIEQRLDNQRYRIREGIKSGVLTNRESRRLHKQQHLIINTTNMFMFDGYLDRYEFNELNHLLNKSSEHIYILKHNDRYRHAHQNRHNRQHRRYYY